MASTNHGRESPNRWEQSIIVSLSYSTSGQHPPPTSGERSYIHLMEFDIKVVHVKLEQEK